MSTRTAGRKKLVRADAVRQLRAGGQDSAAYPQRVATGQDEFAFGRDQRRAGVVDGVVPRLRAACAGMPPEPGDQARSSQPVQPHPGGCRTPEQCRSHLMGRQYPMIVNPFQKKTITRGKAGSGGEKNRSGAGIPINASKPERDGDSSSGFLRHRAGHG